MLPRPSSTQKRGGEIAGVGEAGGFEEDVVEGAATVHESFDGVDAGVSRSVLVGVWWGL